MDKPRDAVKPLRIGLYLRSVPRDGGVFQYGLSMLRAIATLPRDRYTPVVFYTNDQLRPHVESAGVEHHRKLRSTKVEHAIGIASSLVIAAGVPQRSVRSLGDTVDPFVKYLRALNCDLWLFPTGDSVVYRSTLKSVVAVHDLMHLYAPQFPEVGKPLVRWRREFHYRALTRAADAILVDSALGGEHVVDSYSIPNERICVFPFAAADYLLEGRADTGNPQHRALLDKLPREYLYYPAQFWPHKNHLNLVRAVRKCLDRGVSINVVLAGGQVGTHQQFTELARSLGVTKQFTEVGYIPNELVSEVYRRSTGLIYPTHFGPTNIPPIEAIICERPMAVSGNYAMPEQLGNASLYFDPTDVDSIANCMVQLYTDRSLQAQLIENGKAIRHRFEPGTFAKRLQTIIAERTV